MSASYSYKPVPRPVVVAPFSIGLADILARYLIDDGPPPAPRHRLDSVILNNNHIPFLRGVALTSASGTELRKDAEAMIQAIKDHNGVQIEVER